VSNKRKESKDSVGRYAFKSPCFLLGPTWKRNATEALLMYKQTKRLRGEKLLGFEWSSHDPDLLLLLIELYPNLIVLGYLWYWKSKDQGLFSAQNITFSHFLKQGGARNQSLKRFPHDLHCFWEGARSMKCCLSYLLLRLRHCEVSQYFSCLPFSISCQFFNRAICWYSSNSSSAIFPISFFLFL
jgi:hypothetical protein